MTAPNEYYVVAAETYEAKKRHRILIEEVLRTAGISPDLRGKLEAELKQAIIKEDIARHREEDAASEEETEKKEKSEGGDGGAQGDSSSSSGKSSGGGGGGMGLDEEQDGTDGEDFFDYSSFELLALLLFSEQKEPEARDLPTNNAESDDVFLAAATLLFDNNDKAAHIHEPYMPSSPEGDVAAGDYLHSIEQHAAKIGAETMHLRVHPDAVEQMSKRHGYTLMGKPFSHGGTHMQRMTKKLPYTPQSPKI